jgi:hypothetical protein
MHWTLSNAIVKDVVSYKVNKLEPLELEKITIATGEISTNQSMKLLTVS